MAYSLDFRKQVFKVKQKEKLTFQEASDRFGITIRTLFRWSNRLEPKTKRDKPATKVDMNKLEKDVKKHPDAYQYERAERFGVSQSAIYYALQRIGISVKKNAGSSQG
jgi:transposase